MREVADELNVAEGEAGDLSEEVGVGFLRGKREEEDGWLAMGKERKGREEKRDERWCSVRPFRRLSKGEGSQHPELQ